MPEVTVIVPNYNKAPYLGQRLASILDQTHADLELLFLDDASTDGSLDVLAPFARDERVRVIVNRANSGNVFKQWNLGLREARGEFVWIAEADDYADTRFLETMLARFRRHPSVGLACCRPTVVDEQGRSRGVFDCNRWWEVRNQRPIEDYFSAGALECGRYLVISNTIPNASGVLLRRAVAQSLGGAEESWRVAGDWHFWARMLLASDYAFVAEPLNFWRWDARTVRASADATGATLEESYRVVKFIADRVAVDPEALEMAGEFWFGRWRQMSAEAGGFPLAAHLRIFRAARAVDPRVLARVRRELAGSLRTTLRRERRPLS